jgi:hypothetical protein
MEGKVVVCLWFKDRGLLRGWRISAEIVIYSFFGKFVANLRREHRMLPSSWRATFSRLTESINPVA